MIFGQEMRSIIPSICTKMLRDRRENYYNARSKNLEEFQINGKVRIQNEETNKWDRIGKIIEIGKFRKYKIEMSNGRKLWRNRRFLRRCRDNPGNQTQFQMKERLTQKNNNRRVTFDLETQDEITMQEADIQPRIEEQPYKDLDNQGYWRRRRKPIGFYRKLAGLNA